MQVPRYSFKRGHGMALQIGYILRHFPLPSETFVINEIIALQSLGVDIYPMALFPPVDCQEELMTKVHRKSYDLSNADRRGAAEQSPYFAAAQKLAAKYQLSPWYAEFAACVADHVVQNELQLLHAHFATESALTAMLAAELTAVPFTFTAHAYDLFISNAGEPGELRDSRLRVLTKNAYRVITVSEFNKRHILNIAGAEYAAKVKVIHCGIDPERFPFTPRLNADEIRFLCVGRFIEKKGHEFLLQAFRYVATGARDAKLTFAGDGQLKPAIVKLCSDLGLDDNVEFLGAVSSEEIITQMLRADIFVLPSVTSAEGDMEGIPVSLMEAMATGLPVIASRQAGVPELVRDGSSGFLTYERDVGALATRMIELADAPELRRSLGLEGGRYVREHHHLLTEANKLHYVFQQATNPPSDPPRPFISIIIPVYNGEETLGLCLDSIARLDYPADKFEVLVIDNGSTDTSVRIAETHGARILYEHSQKSSYAARNQGIIAAKGDLLAFTDADCIVTPAWLKNLVTNWDDNSIGCFAGEIQAYQPQTLVEKFSDRIGILRQYGTIACTYLPYAQTANAAYRKEVFDKLGLFIPEIFSGGDAEISWRMQQKLGLGIQLIPEALVYHKHRTSITGLYRQFKRYEYGKVLWKKHYSDYDLPTVEQRKRELHDIVLETRSGLSGNIRKLLKQEIDMVDLMTPFLRIVMAYATYKART